MSHACHTHVTRMSVLETLRASGRVPPCARAHLRGLCVVQQRKGRDGHGELDAVMPMMPMMPMS